jgi:glycosyltransferase involved in cell wall biosynthesis
MRVLHVTNNYPSVKNPDYGVFTKDQIDKVKALGVNSDLLFINAREYGIKEYFRAFKKIKYIYKQYDVIHCFHGLTLIVAFLATKKKPILISFLNEIKYENFKKSKVVNEIYVFLYKLIIASNRVFTIFKDKIPENLKNNGRSFYLPNGIDLEAFHPVDNLESCKILNLDPTKKYILFVSSKNIDRSQKRYDIFKSTIEILKVKFASYNFEELIMSNVPRDKCIYYYNASCLHLLTSDYEGSPNSVKESMGCNTPVVSTDVGNVKLMIDKAENCFISSQNPESLAEYIIRSLDVSPCNLRDVLQINNLSSEQKSKELFQIYRKILNGKRNFD